MRRYSAKTHHVACTIFLLSVFICSVSFSQIVIRDTVTISPKKTLLMPGASSWTPMVEATFRFWPNTLPISGNVVASANGVEIPLLILCPYIMWSTNVASFGLVPDGTPVIVQFTSCYSQSASVTYEEDYVRPAPGSITTIHVHLLDRIIGVIEYYVPPLPTVSIFSPRREYPIAVSQDYHPPVVCFAWHTPYPSEDGEPTIVWTPSETIETGQYVDALLTSDTIFVPISVTASNAAGIASDASTLTLVRAPRLDHFVIRTFPDTIAFHEVARLVIQAQDKDSNNISIDDTTQLILTATTTDYGEIIVGSSGGGGGGEGVPVGGVLAPSGIRNKPVAQMTRSAQQMAVQASISAGEGVSISYIDAQYALASFVADKNEPSLIERVGISVVKAADPSKSGFANVTVTEIGCSEVVLSSSEMKPGETIDVDVKRKLSDGTLIRYSARTSFNIGIADGQEYGDLVAYGEAGDSFDGVGVPIQFVAVDSLTADSVTITIRGEPDNESPGTSIIGNLLYGANKVEGHRAKKNGKKFLAASANPSCSGPAALTIRSLKKFCMNNPDWAGKLLDHTTVPLGGPNGKGCALTCLAMVANAGGADVHPGTLVDSMNDSKHYGWSESGTVMWNAINALKGNTLKSGTPVGDGLQRKNDKKKSIDLEKSVAISEDLMDGPLKNGALIIAEVYNPTSTNSHFVVVTGKNSDKYTIMDPACYSIPRTTLSDFYGDKIYKIIVYK